MTTNSTNSMPSCVPTLSARTRWTCPCSTASSPRWPWGRTTCRLAVAARNLGQGRHLAFGQDCRAHARLVLRHANGICCTCARSLTTSSPCSGSASMTAGKVPEIGEWCSGFVQGMALDEVSWQPLLDSDDETTSCSTSDTAARHRTRRAAAGKRPDARRRNRHPRRSAGGLRGRADGLLAAAAQACLDTAPRGAQGRAQRRLPLRQRQEVQEVLRRRRPPALITSRHCPPLRQGPWPARGRRGCAPARRAHGPGARHRTGASGRSCGRCARPPAGSSPAAR
jgi:hypothetical protein